MSFLHQIESYVQEKTLSSELDNEAAFLEVACEYLQAESLISDLNHCYYFSDEGKVLKINGFSIDESEEILSIFITNYDSEFDKIDKNQAISLFKSLNRAFTDIIEKPSAKIPESHILKELQRVYSSELSLKLVRINFYLITNKDAVNKKEITYEEVFGKSFVSNLNFGFNIIDLKELERIHKNNQSLDIVVKNYFDKPIEILSPNLPTDSYSTSLCILPGEFIFKIYEDLGPRLLESNVRSFLSSKVKVNKGIADTIKNKPNMFLAYNNGLCVTVSDIILNEDGSVKEFKNFQIVNGGQTTSSIFFTKLKNIKDIDLSKIYVMAKITKMGRNIDSEIIQKTIARNSNLQNAVKGSDLNSSEEYLKLLHSCSKKYRNANLNNYFYFERTRGQYNVERDLTRNKQFTNLYPTSQKFDKVALSILYYCGLREIKPYISVQSAEKRYDLLSEIMNSESKYVDEQYFIRLTGANILYNQMSKIYGVGENAIGRIRKNVLAYGIGLIQNYLNKQNKSIDFKSIWNKGIDNTCKEKLHSFMKKVNEFLLASFSDGRLDEKCKKEESWKLVVKNFDNNIIEKLCENLPICDQPKYSIAKNVENEIGIHETMINEVNDMISSELYKKMKKCITNEIDNNSATGNSRYSRNHLTILHDHFRPKNDGTLNPYTYKLYLENAKTKKAILELNFKIENIKRIIDALLIDENLNLL